MGSVESVFKFHSYKIDTINLSMKRDLSLLGFAGDYRNFIWHHTIGLRQPTYYTGPKQYLCGINNRVTLKKFTNNREIGRPLVTIKIGIAGLFSVEEKRFDLELEKKIVMVQMPAILFPYVRGAVSAILSTAGFGSVILPLVNVQRIAEEFLKKSEFSIKEIP